MTRQKWMVLGGVAAVGLAVAIVLQVQPAGDQGEQNVWLHDGREFTKPEIEFLLKTFRREGLTDVLEEKGRIRVASGCRAACNKILSSREFAKASSLSEHSASLFPRSLMPPSEQQRLLHQEKIEKIRDVLLRMDKIKDVEIIYDRTKKENFSRDIEHSAIVAISMEGSQKIDPALARSAKQIMYRAFAGMSIDDISVIDGKNGTTVEAMDKTTGGVAAGRTNPIAAETESDWTKQCHRLLAEYGEPIVKIELETASAITQRSVAEVPETSSAGNSDKVHQMEAVLNGEGKINVRHKVVPVSHIEHAGEQSATSGLASDKDFAIKSMKISFPRSAVEKYLSAAVGQDSNLNDQQFARGVTGLRNETTRRILAWGRSEGVSIRSELISVTIDSESKDSKDSMNVVNSPSDSSPGEQPSLILIVAGMGVGILALGVLAYWQFNFKRNNKTSSSAAGEYSVAGRTFVNRNMANTGAVLVDEIEEVVQNDPETSARAFAQLFQVGAS